VHRHCHDTAGGSEDDPIGGCSALVFGPVLQKRDLIDMTVNPIAVREIVIDQSVDDVEGREEGQEVTIIFNGELIPSIHALLSTVGRLFRGTAFCLC
jgi:hypothetical protein